MIYKNLFLEEKEKIKLELPKSAMDKTVVNVEFDAIELLEIESKSSIKACYRGSQLNIADKYYNLHLNHLTEGDYRVVTKVDELEYITGTIESIERKIASNNNEYADIVVLVDKSTSTAKQSDKIKVKLWDKTLKAIHGDLKKNDYVFLENPKFEEKYNQWLPQSVIIEESGIVGFSEEKQIENLNDLKDWISEIGDESEKLASFLLDLVEEHHDLLLTAPAAKKNHHAYIGGLVHHILEVCKTGAVIAKTYNDMYDNSGFKMVNVANIIAGCIAHDFGKIFEYKWNTETGEITYNNDFADKWKNNKVPAHIEWGYFTFKVAGFDEIADIIASHHKSIEYGARFEPRTPEEHIVFMSDYMSSVLGYNDLQRLKFYLSNAEKFQSGED